MGHRHADDDADRRLEAHVSGHVQGVGFRWWVSRRAEALGLAGEAANLADGRVRVIAEGPGPACGELLADLRDPSARHGRPGEVSEVEARWAEPRGEAGFGTR